MTKRFRGREDRGQALVELALVLTILLTLLLGIIEVGRIGHAYLVVLHASREGARLGAIGQDDNAIRAGSKQRRPPFRKQSFPLRFNRPNGNGIPVSLCG